MKPSKSQPSKYRSFTTPKNLKSCTKSQSTCPITNGNPTRSKVTATGNLPNYSVTSSKTKGCLLNCSDWYTYSFVIVIIQMSASLSYRNPRLTHGSRRCIPWGVRRCRFWNSPDRPVNPRWFCGCPSRLLRFGLGRMVVTFFEELEAEVGPVVDVLADYLQGFGVNIADGWTDLHDVEDDLVDLKHWEDVRPTELVGLSLGFF